MVNSKLPDINYVLMTQLSDLKCKIDEKYTENTAAQIKISTNRIFLFLFSNFSFQYLVFNFFYLPSHYKIEKNYSTEK